MEIFLFGIALFLTFASRRLYCLYVVRTLNKRGDTIGMTATAFWFFVISQFIYAYLIFGG